MASATHQALVKLWVTAIHAMSGPILATTVLGRAPAKELCAPLDRARVLQRNTGRPTSMRGDLLPVIFRRPHRNAAFVIASDATRFVCCAGVEWKGSPQARHEDRRQCGLRADFGAADLVLVWRNHRAPFAAVRRHGFHTQSRAFEAATFLVELLRACEEARFSPDEGGGAASPPVRSRAQENVGSARER